MNNKVKFLRGTSTEYEASTKDNDTFYYTTDTKKLYLGRTEITSIEVDDTSTTATDKTWSAKKISDSIPTTLPANGGNADTVDGKHASDFMQNLGTLTTGSLLDYVLTLTSSGSLFISSSVTDTPISGLYYGVDVIRHKGGDYVITATRFNGGGVWTNRYNAGAKKWYGWANVADGGNAASVGGRSITVTDVDPGAGSALNTGEIVFVTEVT